jgi:hypothetical protein
MKYARKQSCCQCGYKEKDIVLLQGVLSIDVYLCKECLKRGLDIIEEEDRNKGERYEKYLELKEEFSCNCQCCKNKR